MAISQGLGGLCLLLEIKRPFGVVVVVVAAAATAVYKTLSSARTQRPPSLEKSSRRLEAAVV